MSRLVCDERHKLKVINNCVATKTYFANCIRLSQTQLAFLPAVEFQC